MISFLPVTEDDLPQIKEFIEQEPTHRNLYAARFFYVGGPSCLCTCKFCDERGAIVFVRIEKPNADGLIMLLPQFAPNTPANRRRIVKAFRIAFKPFLTALQQNTDAKGIYVETKSPGLISTLTKRFGFVKSDGDNYQFLFTLEN